MATAEPTVRSESSDWLRSAGIIGFSIFASFGTYFCMYAFRKPFSAAKYEGYAFFGTGLDLKTAFVVSQIFGYALSKYIGIKVCSEITPRLRAWALVGFIAIAELALLLFAVLPTKWKFLALFLNGLPLGMVWGLVVWYLEGRRSSEMLLAGLSCSYIVASGIVKDVGRYLMRVWEVPEFWMPFSTGLVFLLPFLLFVFLLTRIPKPNNQDIDERVERQPMQAASRWSFVREFAFGLVVLFVVYFFLTAFRDIRDNFGQELWGELGYEEAPGKFSRSESFIGLGCLFVFAFLALVRNNRWGLMLAFGIMAVGLGLLGLGTWAYDNGTLATFADGLPDYVKAYIPVNENERIDGFVWMIVIGFGAYLAYIPFGSLLFDRIIASTRVVATSVFAIYVADAVGYTGSVGLTIYKDICFQSVKFSYVDFFRYFSYGMATVGVVLMIVSGLYFYGKSKPASRT